MTEKTVERLYQELKKREGKTDAFFSSMFGLKNTRSFQTSSAASRYKRGIIQVLDWYSKEHMPWVECESCGYYNVDSELDTQETIGSNCVKCGAQIHEP